MYDSLYCFFSAGSATRRRSNVPLGLILALRARGKVGTFVLLQATDLFENRLQVHVEPMAVAEQLQEVARPNGAACVVDEFAGRGQTIGEDFKLLPLQERKNKHLCDLQPPVVENMLH